jgi:hypothetical protein
MSGNNIDTTPYCTASVTFLPFVKLAEDLVVDVVAVGSGVTGLMAVYLSARSGKQVVLLERDRYAMTDTGHTSAHGDLGTGRGATGERGMTGDVPGGTH